MSLEIVSYSDEHEARWESMCNCAGNATLLHTRKFLSYHGARFTDASVLIFDTGRLLGVMPAAQALHDSTLIVSHPGTTYGGIVHQGKLAGATMLETLSKLKEFYRAHGHSKLLYKALPHGYARVPAQDDLYALFRLGAQRVRCDLSCMIDLSTRREPSEQRRRSLKKARTTVTLSNAGQQLGSLWKVLSENLARKHDATPTHSLAELSMLLERFPEHIQIRSAMIDGKVEAGIVLFNSPNVWHAQYIASSEIGNKVSALDAVFESAIAEARESGARFFDFGTSNEQDGRILNTGLYHFKATFGGGGMAHEYYELAL